MANNSLTKTFLKIPMKKNTFGASAAEIISGFDGCQGVAMQLLSVFF